ncbi:MAG: hypothetical protein DDT19_00009 [Syntrophomonadaceae bacterium]|nr:hypothetical protein [Bacillota bacterium]
MEKSEKNISRVGVVLKWLSMAVIALVAIALVTLVLTGCSPAIRKLPKEDIKDEAIKQKIAEAKAEGEKTGFAKAKTLCEAKMTEELSALIRKYRKEMMYLEFVRGGLILPGQVTMRYNPGVVSDDGSSFISPTLSWKITAPPVFLPQEIAKWERKDKDNFCYLFLKVFPSETEAMREVGRAEKPADAFLMSVVYADGSNRYAVIAKAPKESCDKTMDFFKGRGYLPVRVN